MILYLILELYGVEMRIENLPGAFLLFYFNFFLEFSEMLISLPVVKEIQLDFWVAINGDTALLEQSYKQKILPGFEFVAQLVVSLLLGLRIIFFT